jgi:two-component system, chemotaxis family, protein-glutamate methylesterase/glutaminase
MVALPQRPIIPGKGTASVRVAVVDDSVVVRGLLSKWLSETPGVEVVGTFRSGREIIDALPALAPKIILLDLDMPDMDGLTALPLITARSPESRVIVVSSLSVHGAELTMRSLMRGATDYLPKPSNHREVSTSADFRQALVAKVLAVGGVRALARSAPASAASPVMRVPGAPGITPPAPNHGLPFGTPANQPHAPADQGQVVTPMRAGMPARPQGGVRPLAPIRPKVIVIGASTGGPQALVATLEGMRKAITQVPIIIAQHMPPIFASIFTTHLKQHAGFPTQEATEGLPLVPGTIFLAPGGCHTVMRARADGQAFITMLPSEARGPWRPSIDLLFSSAAECFGSHALAIALTGMGRDGTEGATHLARRGANIIVQDEASSVVWGIPGSIAEAGLACAQLPPQKLGEMAQSLLEGHSK